MVKFNTVVSMNCYGQTSHDILKLTNKLEKLGYADKFVKGDAPNERYPLLVNNYGNFHNTPNELGYYNAKRAIHLHRFNPELYLALCAMTEGKDWIVGEYLVLISGGNVFKCLSTTLGNDYTRGEANNNCSSYRKATILEIFEHFNVPLEHTSTDTKTESNKETHIKTKPMKISKTETISIKGRKRVTTIVVLINGTQVRAGYSIKAPSDKEDNDLADKIATGRANSDRTNLVTMEVGKGMNKKYILYAVAEDILRQLERGRIEIKGIK